MVNNAGMSTFGEVEFTTMDTYKQVSEVNLWGTIRVTKAFLPLIRRSKGKIITTPSAMNTLSCSPGVFLRSTYLENVAGLLVVMNFWG